MSIAAGASSVGSALGGGAAAGGAAAGLNPYMMAAQFGIGALSAAFAPKFKLKEDSTIEDAKAYASERANKIPLIGGLFGGLAEKIAERKWQPVFDNREAKEFQQQRFQADTAKMDSLLQQRMDRLKDIDLFKDYANKENARPWQI